MVRYNKQRVILETEEGTAKNGYNLKQVWQERLKKIAPHYKVKSVKILRKENEI